MVESKRDQLVERSPFKAKNLDHRARGHGSVVDADSQSMITSMVTANDYHPIIFFTFEPQKYEVSAIDSR